MKTLHLLRHAKSDWSDPSTPDRERSLNERGKKARHDVARHVDGWPVDLVVCSTARRARSTAEPVAGVLRCPVRFDAALYDAGGDVRSVVSLVRALPDDAATVMVIGHNPWIEELTDLLCGTSPRYPTAALGTVELDVDAWREVGAGSGRLVRHVTPAELRAH